LLVWYNSGIMPVSSRELSVPLNQLELERDKYFQLATTRESEAVNGNKIFWDRWRDMAVQVAKLRTQEVRGQRVGRNKHI